MRLAPADVFFVAGEASGDFEASLLAKALVALQPDTRMAAVGGLSLRTAGAAVVYDSTELASLGPLSVIPKLPLLYGILCWLDMRLRRQPPRLLVPVDAGGFNLPLLRRLRRNGYGGKALYYFPPGAWVDDEGQARAVAAHSLALTPFAHQRDFYRRLGLPVEHFGHPLVSVISARTPAETAAATSEGAPPLIAILPGSRQEEVARFLPTLAAAAQRMRAACAARFVIVASSGARAEQIARLWPRVAGPQDAEVERAPAVHVVKRAQLAWTASGTAVLETALCAVPQVAFYAISSMQYRIARRKVPAHLMRTITLPNLVLGRRIVPELLQSDFRPENLVTESLQLLGDQTAVSRQLDGYAELRAALGPNDALQHIAAFVSSLLQRSPARA